MPQQKIERISPLDELRQYHLDCDDYPPPLSVSYGGLFIEQCVRSYFTQCNVKMERILCERLTFVKTQFFLQFDVLTICTPRSSAIFMRSAGSGDETPIEIVLPYCHCSRMCVWVWCLFHVVNTGQTQNKRLVRDFDFHARWYTLLHVLRPRERWWVPYGAVVQAASEAGNSTFFAAGCCGTDFEKLYFGRLTSSLLLMMLMAMVQSESK